jgi:hypothetical protein
MSERTGYDAIEAALEQAIGQWQEALASYLPNGGAVSRREQFHVERQDATLGEE